MAGRKSFRVGRDFLPFGRPSPGETIGTRVALVAPCMELEAALRSEVAKLWAAMEVVAPRIARPRAGWLFRFAAFLRGLSI